MKMSASVVLVLFLINSLLEKQLQVCYLRPEAAEESEGA